ncbi:unnamed protein product [Heterobilharzia americana]|nr:unnamed protein product [Heterobilharzia americana]
MIKRLKKLKQFTLSTDEDKDSASNQSTEEKYAYNCGLSIPSLSLNNCGSKLLHQYVWFQRNLLTDEKMMLSNLTETLSTNNRISSNIQTSCIQPIPCTFNYNQLMSSFTTPQQYWPIFDVPVSASHYELKYTDKFELNTAMDYAKLIPMEINYRELLPLKQQQHHHRQQERPQDQMLTNPMMPISSKLFDDNKTPESRISTSTKNPVNSAISLPKSLHSLPKSNVYTDNYLYNHYLNLTSVNHSTLKDYSNSLISSLNKTISSLHHINPSSLSNSTYLDTILLSLNQAESHQTLTKWSSSSKSHKPLIPIPLFSCSEIQETSTDQVTSKENTTFKNYQLNENGSEYIEEMVEQDVKEWLTRFPELNSLLMNKNEDRKAKHNEETYTELNNPLLHLNNAPIEESKKYADEILSAFFVHGGDDARLSHYDAVDFCRQLPTNLNLLNETYVKSVVNNNVTLKDYLNNSSKDYITTSTITNNDTTTTTNTITVNSGNKNTSNGLNPVEYIVHGELLSLHSPAMIHVLMSWILSIEARQFWIGGLVKLIQHEFNGQDRHLIQTWTDHTPVTIRFLHYYNPLILKLYPNEIACLSVDYASGKWGVHYCNERKYFVCELVRIPKILREVVNNVTVSKMEHHLQSLNMSDNNQYKTHQNNTHENVTTIDNLHQLTNHSIKTNDTYHREEGSNYTTLTTMTTPYTQTTSMNFNLTTINTTVTMTNTTEISKK